MSVLPNKESIENFSLKTAQDLSQFRKGLVPIELPKILQAPNSKAWLIDQNLLIYVERVRDSFYCEAKDKQELLRVIRYADHTVALMSARVRVKSHGVSPMFYN